MQKLTLHYLGQNIRQIASLPIILPFHRTLFQSLRCMEKRNVPGEDTSFSEHTFIETS